jgi:hypothetical protein
MRNRKQEWYPCPISQMIPTASLVTITQLNDHTWASLGKGSCNQSMGIDDFGAVSRVGNARASLQRV